MGQNGQVQKDGSKKIGPKQLVKHTDLKRRVQIGASKSKRKCHQNKDVPKTEISQ